MNEGGPNDLRSYVCRVIDAYVRLPATPSRPRREDRHLAGELHQRGVPFETVEAALLLAAARRAQRPDGASPLPPIRSLHYFMPVIEEILRDPPRDSYIDYLRDVVAELQEEPQARRDAKPARVQKATFSRER